MAGVLLCTLTGQALKGEPWVGSCSIVQCIRRLLGQPLYCSAADAGLWGEAMVMAPPPTCDSAVSPCFHGCPAFLHRHFPPQSPLPSICLSAVNSSPRPGIAPHFPNSSSQPLRLLGDTRPCPGYDLRPCLGYVWHGCGKDCLILIPFRLPQISCFTLSLKCFSSDSDRKSVV